MMKNMGCDLEMSLSEKSPTQCNTKSSSTNFNDSFISQPEKFVVWKQLNSITEPDISLTRKHNLDCSIQIVRSKKAW